MQEQITEILVLLKGASKYKWVAMILAWVFCFGGWLYVQTMPNKYTSEARVHVETRTMLQPLLSGMTVQSDIRALLRVMQLLMFTKNNLEQIIHLANLDKNIKNSSDLQGLIGHLKGSIQIIGGGDDMFTIRYEADNPDKAKNVVQAVLTVFSEQTQMSTLAGADEAHQFIDEQIREYEIRLRNGEKARENFKRANLGLLPGQGGDQIGQIQQISTALEDTKQQLNEAMSRKSALKIQLDEALAAEDDEDWGSVAGIQTQTRAEDARITELKQRKENLLIKFTAKHPEVVYINKTIKKLEEAQAEKKAKAEPQEEGQLNSAVMTNPYVQTIKVAMNDTDANIASIHSRVEMFEKRLKTAQDELNMRLSVETEIQNLNRDYETIKRNYEQLLHSREQVTMSKKVDDQAESLKFKIADAPNTPLRPSSPNRKLLYSAVLGGSVVFGLAVAFLIYLLRPTIMSASQLRQITGLPVLGTVSLKISSAQAEKNKKDILRFNVAILGLALVYMGFMTVETLGIKLAFLSRLFQSIH